jgi:ribulose-5-phosphate 4-epimerase/fuculose-1-phosphate aldolase
MKRRSRDGTVEEETPMVVTAESTQSEFSRASTGVQISPQAELAVLARALHREGWDDHNAGHITYTQPDGTMLLNPHELFWDEITESDVLRVDMDGNLLEGKWTVMPAVQLHLALHRARPEVMVAVHNHPHWATVWAAFGEIPPIYDQTAAMIADEVLTFYDDYTGTVIASDIAEDNVKALGDCTAAYLANHGVFVMADSIARSYVRCSSLEWRSRIAWEVHALGKGIGKPMRPEAAANLAQRINERQDPWPHLWDAVVRRELRLDPSILS